MCLLRVDISHFLCFCISSLTPPFSTPISLEASRAENTRLHALKSLENMTQRRQNFCVSFKKRVEEKKKSAYKTL